MASIFDSVIANETQALSDVIVTSVFMGLVGERLDAGRQIFIGYGGGFDAYDIEGNGRVAKDVENRDVERHRQLKNVLERAFPGHHQQLIIGAANKWVDASKEGRTQTPASSFAITGAVSATQVHKPMSGKASGLALDLLRSNRDRYGINIERGAYYGIADLDSDEVYGPISTSRQLYWPASGRWMDTKNNGWIQGEEGRADGSYARMADTQHERLISDGLGSDGYVLGYTHGMIFAEHICKASGGGTAYEVSMNEHTCKNASCFGCATFMFANGMPPSWMHLGKAESWSPLPEDARNFSYSAHFEGGLLEDVASGMNREWSSAVARWMRAGSLFLKMAPQSGFLKGSLAGKADQVLANWFLDALTIHRSDVDRINTVLGP